MPKKKPDTFDPLLWLGILFAGGAAAGLFGYLLWLFISVVFLGRSSSCPQNLC